MITTSIGGRPRARRFATLATATILLAAGVIWAGPLPGRSAGKGIVVGLEYAILNSRPLVQNMADAFAETGMTGMKHYAEAVEWGEMQKGPNQAIDFTHLDWFVREYQDCGFTELTVTLKSHSKWGSKHVPLLGKYTDPTPKPEYAALYEAWIEAVVERYDADGKDDMPGLRWPVHYYEIGSEFSSYEPEPADAYLAMLAVAYRAAHRAFAGARVGHAAFLITPVNLDVAGDEYERAWLAVDHPDKHHALADQRTILDHPESFDFVNLHNLGWPYEIEAMMKWLRYETGRRGYAKPVVISDTVPTSYIGWGSATNPKKGGTIALPATEADRPRLADFFARLLKKDADALAWTRGFVAADQVQRTIVAAEQGVALINLSFTGDLPLLTLPAFQAGAGISAWGGALDVNAFTGAVVQKYPLFHALRQLMGHLNGYDAIERVRLPDAHARVYRLTCGGKPLWVAWFDPGRAILPEDGQPSLEAAWRVDCARVTVETAITGMGQNEAERRSESASNGSVKLRLTHTPVYVIPE